ncbi:MAG: hypothetical protein J0I34_07385 [Pseudonocardia sp.]|uniref:hypothetical protein n=1 Tax=Actinomycetes TaxID=1760 RepID=UPI000868AC48|nr:MULTISPECIES: hypothetical protein [Actinomycetes]MBN9108590.1 hypothetical protein [Pseudonocardia sp.]ODU27469.1 MAG: hypothetical protein ABS80_03570 [Pseudonocardia sp. SCN 72-51]ODV07769.1 MAG: hypothetical protein ABT15_06750 [Pseudonocardia sp. SCN 73-27]
MSATEHDIETSVRVYLDWVDGRWEVAGATVDGYALDERDTGPACDTPHRTEAERAACRRLMEQVSKADMPTAAELVELLRDALGES